MTRSTVRTRTHAARPIAGNTNALKRAPSEWKTGDEPLTAAQRSYLETLATEAGKSVDNTDALTKAEASEKIDELRHATGRDQTGTDL